MTKGSRAPIPFDMRAHVVGLLRATASRYVTNKAKAARQMQIIIGITNNWDVLKEYDISSTYLRKAHFVAQIAHESGNFGSLEEYASGRAYEGRKDLGNIHPGDGMRFKGRSIMQLTGRYNYDKMTQALRSRAVLKKSESLVDAPKLAMHPRISVHIACVYWSEHRLNALADNDDIIHITERINGGTNGLADRVRKLARAKKYLTDDIYERVLKHKAPVAAPMPVKKPIFHNAVNWLGWAGLY